MKSRFTACKCIGNTPLIKISDKLYAKLETPNPSGSIKDRMALYILDRAEEKGEIQPGATIVEATSGNTGIAFSMLAAERKYRMIVVMPSNMSTERKQMIKAFGAEIIEVGPGDFAGAVEKRDVLVKELNAFCPNQFANLDNIECHYKTTGQEIINQIPDDLEISAVVAGTGTGGTLMGLSQALLEKFPNCKTVAVEPTESAVMSGGEPGEHFIQGIGDGFIPDLVDMKKVDEVVTVSSEESLQRMKELTKEQALLVGISSGANVAAAEKYIKNYNPNGIVVTVLADRQERYLSML
ncbi:MAG: cysteine synthase family protein [bacterium]|nr:cysteine synthase family protein [bacterium]